MITRNTFVSAAIAGVLVAVLSAVPGLNLVNCLLCGWLWLGGIFAVYLYKRFSGMSLETGPALLLGLLTGLIGAVLSTLIQGLLSTRTPIPPETITQLESVFGQNAQMLAQASTSIAITLITNLVLYSLFGVIGAAIGSLIFKPKTNPGL